MPAAAMASRSTQSLPRTQNTSEHSQVVASEERQLGARESLVADSARRLLVAGSGVEEDIDRMPSPTESDLEVPVEDRPVLGEIP